MGIGTGDVPAFDGMHEASARVAGGSIDARAGDPRGHGRPRVLAGRRTAPCDALPRVGLLRLQRRRAGGRGRARRRPSGPLRRPRRPSRRRHAGALLGRPRRPDVLDPRERPHAVPGHRAGPTRPVDPGRPGPRSTSRSTPTRATRAGGPSVEASLPALAEAFAPTFLVSQHGCDSHALDPLAHLRLTTASYAARDATARRARSRALRRPLVRDRGRWLRRLPGRAAVVGARVARAGPSRHARRDAARLARTVGGGSARATSRRRRPRCSSTRPAACPTSPTGMRHGRWRWHSRRSNARGSCWAPEPPAADAVYEA